MHARVELAVTAALLHDVVDDTRVELAEVEGLFEGRVGCLVATVTQLSQMNQLMRRKHRKAALSSQTQARVRRRDPCLLLCLALRLHVV